MNFSKKISAFAIAAKKNKVCLQQDFSGKLINLFLENGQEKIVQI